MKYFTSIIISLFFFMNVSCNSQALPELPPKEFSEQIKNENVILLDVRTPGEYAEGHLKGATLINYLDENFEEQVLKLDKNKTVYVYCRSGGRSGNAQEIMLKQNFKSVINLDGGIDAWQKAGLPIEN